MTRGWLAASRTVKDRRGVAAAEYAILAVGVIIIVGFSVVTLFEPSTGAYRIMANTLTSTISSLVTLFGG